jgi:hypothetical protein
MPISSLASQSDSGMLNAAETSSTPFAPKFKDRRGETCSSPAGFLRHFPNRVFLSGRRPRRRSESLHLRPSSELMASPTACGDCCQQKQSGERLIEVQCAYNNVVAPAIQDTRTPLG